MKKILVLFSTTAILCVLLAFQVFAIDSPSSSGIYFNEGDVGSEFTVSPLTATGQTVTAQTIYDCDGDGVADDFYEGVEKFVITYTPKAGIELGANYVISMYTGDSLGVDSVLYLNQQIATAADVQYGSISFTVYPSEIDTATIALTSDSFSGAITVVEINLYDEYMLGDVNLDGYITTADAVLTLQYIVGTKDLTSTQIKAADVDGGGTVATSDAVKILAYVVNGTPF